MATARTPDVKVFGDVVLYHFANDAATVRLVALHGALRAAKDLAILADLLPEVELITIDLPGHGDAPHSSAGYSAERLADAVGRALSHFPNDRPSILLGESFSGLAALTLATHESRATHVVLIDTPLDTQRMLASQSVLLRTYQQRPDIAPMVAGISQDFFGLDVERQRVTRRTYYHYLQNCRVPITMITGALKLPSAVGAGAFFDQPDIDHLKSLPGFTVVEVAKAGHSVLRAQPNAVAAVIRQIAARHA
jgi:pimeloyl-ACP methyl ester carboxylesterase